MKLPFYKFHGTGNDFILIDERITDHNLNLSQIKGLCNRHFGIGADGLMLLKTEIGYDFRMVYYNSDGSESTMCGNGGRCMISFAKKLGLVNKEAKFIAIDGEHTGIITEQGHESSVVKLKMKDVLGIKTEKAYDFLDTGSPHAVIYDENAEVTDVVSEGRKIRYSRTFAEVGTNVDFVKISDSGLIVRSYERGVENETLSCGTGVTASVLSFAGRNPDLQSPCKVKTVGGELIVYFKRKEKGFVDIWLEGPATFVFNGEIEI